MESVCVTLDGWDPIASVRRRNIIPANKTAVPKVKKAASVPIEESVFVANVCVATMTLGKCGGNTANVMTSPACGSRVRCAQDMDSVTAGIASASLTGREITVTVPRVQTCVCPAVGSYVVEGDSVSVESVTAPNRVHTETPVKNVQLVQMPVPLKRIVWNVRSLNVVPGLRRNRCVREYVVMRSYLCQS